MSKKAPFLELKDPEEEEDTVERLIRSALSRFPEGTKDYLKAIVLTLPPKQDYEHEETIAEEYGPDTTLRWRYAWSKRSEKREDGLVNFAIGQWGFYSCHFSKLPEGLK